MLLHHKRLYLTSPHLFCFWFLEGGVSLVLLYSNIVHLVLVSQLAIIFSSYIETKWRAQHTSQVIIMLQKDARLSILVTVGVAVRVAAVMASLALNGFADLYYARFRPELRDYLRSASSPSSSDAMKRKSNAPAAMTNEIELKGRGQSNELAFDGAALLEGGAARGNAATASASVFTFAAGSKHKSMSPEVFASFLSRSIYFWLWG